MNVDMSYCTDVEAVNQNTRTHLFVYNRFICLNLCKTLGMVWTLAAKSVVCLPKMLQIPSFLNP
jgi:hypothetical protein